MNKYEKFSIAVAIATATYVCIMIMGCNAYKGIEKKPPLTSKDSARLSARALKTFPPKPPVIKKGQTIYIKDTAALAKLKKQLDSIKSLPQKVLRLQDSCGKESIEAFNNGNLIGYQQGFYEGKLSCPPSTQQTDTVFQRSHADDMLIFDQAYKLKLAEADNVKKDKIIEDKNQKLSNRTITILSLIILLLLSGGINYLQARKNKIIKKG